MLLGIMRSFNAYTLSNGKQNPLFEVICIFIAPSKICK